MHGRAHGPDEESPWRGRNICFFAFEVNVGRDEDGGNVGPKEQQIHEHIDDLLTWMSKNY